MLDLPLRTCRRRASRGSCPDYFDVQPMARVGVAVDAGLRPVGPDGSRVHERVLVAGASIGGAVPWKEHSGEGISVTTGYHAAGEIVPKASPSVGRSSQSDDLPGARATA